MIGWWPWWGGWGHHGWHYQSGDKIKLDVDGFDELDDVLAAATQDGDDVVIDFGGGDSLTLQDVTLGGLNHNDFVFV